MASTSQEEQPLFLGLDLSTQGLKAVLITEESEVVHESAVNFDRELPHYGTTNGAVKGPEEGEVTSPVRMWLEAIDLIVSKMKTAGVNLGRIMGISGDGQVRKSSKCDPSCANFPLSNMAPSSGHLRQNACSQVSALSKRSQTSFRRLPSPSSALPFGKTPPPLANVVSLRRHAAALRLSQTLLVAVHTSVSQATKSAE